MSTVPKCRFVLVVFVILFILGGCTVATVQVAPAQQMSTRVAKTVAPIPVKVLIITSFSPEADAWLKQLAFDQAIPVPGLSADYPNVHCTATDICLVTTGMGHTNAAVSMTALVLNGKFDFSHTYFIVTGIAGIDPNLGTIGTAAWARYLVDFGLAHEIDAREMPSAWQTGYFGIDANNPDTKPDLRYKTEVFRLDEALLQRAVAFSRQVTLEDTDAAKAYRKFYKETAARAAPSVLQCDTSSGDTYWHGRELGLRSTRWTALLTDGKGTYCTTQQEDNATYEALKRGAAAGLLDISRIAVLRTAANFDRPHPGQTAYESLNSKSGGFGAAIANLYHAAWPLVNDIVTRWQLWRDAVPAQ